MDGDRPMADRRDILESELQELIRDALIYGWYKGSDDDTEFEITPYHDRIHELLISYLDGETGDVGAQDEASESREVGNDVRSETDMRGLGFKPTMFEEIADEICREIRLRFAQEGKRVAMGHCDLTKLSDGSIRASIEYGPTDFGPRKWPWNPSGN